MRLAVMRQVDIHRTESSGVMIWKKNESNPLERVGKATDRCMRSRFVANSRHSSSGLPAFAARSSRVQSNGRKRRSCSPG